MTRRTIAAARSPPAREPPPPPRFRTRPGPRPSARRVAGPAMPSATRPRERCQRLRARWVCGPKAPSAGTPSARWSARTPPPPATERARARLWRLPAPARLSTGPRRRPSARRVAGPAMPSATRPCARCQRFRARSVWGPKTPSAEIPSARCSEATPPPRERVLPAAAAASGLPATPATSPMTGAPVTASRAASDRPRGEGEGISGRRAAASLRVRESQTEWRHNPSSVRSRGTGGSRSRAASPGMVPARRRRSCERSIASDHTSRLARSLWTELKAAITSLCLGLTPTR